MKKIIKVYMLFASIALVALTFILANFFLNNRPNTSEQQSVDVVSNSYTFLSNQDNKVQDNLVNFVELRQNLNSYFESENINGSLYFEYLPTGTSIRINSNEDAEITDLLKVPIAMELYKSAELGLIDLNRKVDIRPDQLTNSGGTWEQYTSQNVEQINLKQAVQRMLQNDDETAKNIIVDSISSLLGAEQSVFNDIDAEYNTDQDKAQSMNSRSYASILKCLYYSCSLNPQNSNEVLSLLAKSPTTGGLKQPLKNEILPIAGKANSLLNDEQSDCGIFYLERRNYVLCVFLKKPTGQDTRTVIFSDISKDVFNFVNDSRR